MVALRREDLPAEDSRLIVHLLQHVHEALGLTPLGKIQHGDHHDEGRVVGGREEEGQRPSCPPNVVGGREGGGGPEPLLPSQGSGREEEEGQSPWK